MVCPKARLPGTIPDYYHPSVLSVSQGLKSRNGTRRISPLGSTQFSGLAAICTPVGIKVQLGFPGEGKLTLADEPLHVSAAEKEQKRQKKRIQTEHGTSKIVLNASGLS
jgi:hypothetical protein